MKSKNRLREILRSLENPIRVTVMQQGGVIEGAEEIFYAGG